MKKNAIELAIAGAIGVCLGMFGWAQFVPDKGVPVLQECPTVAESVIEKCAEMKDEAYYEMRDEVLGNSEGPIIPTHTCPVCEVCTECYDCTPEMTALNQSWEERCIEPEEKCRGLECIPRIPRH